MKKSEEWILGDPNEPPRPKQREQVDPENRAKIRAKPKKRGSALGRLALFLVWFVFFLAGVVGTGFLAAGAVRDTTNGDARVALDLSIESSRTVDFKPWIPGRYFLYLETIDGSDRNDPKAFKGRLEMVVSKPDGAAVVAEPFEPPGLNHYLNGGTEWTRLKDFYVAKPSFDPWKATITVQTGDPAFANSRSSLVVMRDRRLPGIEGLVNYELAWPAVAMFALALLTGLTLRRRGGTWVPSLLSLLGLGAIGWLYSLV
jgi:hypothetical protein